MTVRAAAAFDEFLSHARQSHTWPRTNLYKTKRPKAFGLAQWLLPADNPLVAHTAELPPNPCLRCVTSATCIHLFHAFVAVSCIQARKNGASLHSGCTGSFKRRIGCIGQNGCMRVHWPKPLVLQDAVVSSFTSSRLMSHGRFSMWFCLK